MTRAKEVEMEILEMELNVQIIEKKLDEIKKLEVELKEAKDKIQMLKLCLGLMEKFK